MKEMNVSRWKLPWIAKDFIRLMKERDEEIHLFEGMRDHLIELHKQGICSQLLLQTLKKTVKMYWVKNSVSFLAILMVARLYLAKRSELSVFSTFWT